MAWQNSSIENILHIFHIFFHSISFCLQKPVHYFIIHQKILHVYKDLHPQKNRTNLHFPQNSFLRTLIKKVVSLSFSFSKLKIVQKVQNSFSTVKLFKKFKRFKGCKGCKLFSLSFLFSFPFL